MRPGQSGGNIYGRFTLQYATRNDDIKIQRESLMVFAVSSKFPYNTIWLADDLRSAEVVELADTPS